MFNPISLQASFDTHQNLNRRACIKVACFPTYVSTLVRGSFSLYGLGFLNYTMCVLSLFRPKQHSTARLIFFCRDALLERPDLGHPTNSSRVFCSRGVCSTAVLQPLPKCEEADIGRKSPHLSHLDLLLSLDGDIRWRNGGGENRLSPKRLKRGDGDRRRSRPDDDNGLRSYRS